MIIKNSKINYKNYYDKVEETWKYIDYRRIKDKSKNQKNFWKATIKGIRNNLGDNSFKFVMKENHCVICMNIKNNEKYSIKNEENGKSDH